MEARKEMEMIEEVFELAHIVKEQAAALLASFEKEGHPGISRAEMSSGCRVIKAALTRAKGCLTGVGVYSVHGFGIDKDGFRSPTFVPKEAQSG